MMNPLETSTYDDDASGDFLDNEQETETSQVDNGVEFQSDRPIEPQDIELILMFLESPKLSCGGNIADHVVDSKRRIIIVNYENKLVKQRVLAKRFLKFQNYQFLINDSIKEFNFKLENRVLVLSNIPDTQNKSMIQMYAESLVLLDNELNDVESLAYSKFFKNTYFVKFKQDFDMDQCKKRLAKHPTLNDRKVSLLQAYATHIVLIQFNSNVKVTPEMIIAHFSNKKRYPDYPLQSIRELEPYFMLKFNSEQAAKDFISNKQELFKKETIMEYVWNIDLLSAEIEKYEMKKNKNLFDLDFENFSAEIKRQSKSTGALDNKAVEKQQNVSLKKKIGSILRNFKSSNKVQQQQQQKQQKPK